MTTRIRFHSRKRKFYAIETREAWLLLTTNAMRCTWLRWQ